MTSCETMFIRKGSSRVSNETKPGCGGENMRHGSVKEQTDALKLLHELHSVSGFRNNPASSNKTQTVAEKARKSLLRRFEEILSQIICIEQDLIKHLPEDMKNFLRHKVRKIFRCRHIKSIRF